MERNYHYRATDIAELAIAQLMSLGYELATPPSELSYPEQVKWMYDGRWRRDTEPQGVPLDFKVMRVGNTYLRDATHEPALDNYIYQRDPEIEKYLRDRDE